MSMQETRLYPAARPAKERRTVKHRFKAAVTWLAEWLSDCADQYAAARLYDRLSRLSDAELARRGLHRSTLAHDVLRDRDGGRP